jgi:hypothetical protein
MNMTAEAVTLTFPRSVIGGVMSISAKLVDRMHELLERNTDGSLSPLEREELETLVQMAEFSQLLSTALAAQARP